MVEDLEVRRLLSAIVRTKGANPTATTPKPITSPKAPKPTTFKTNIDGKGTGTFTANSGTRDGTRVTINVGSVVNISRATANQTEADIAINPTNPNQIFAQSNVDVGTGLFGSRSNDGGVNWTTGMFATGSDGLTAACCDGRVIYDKFGNLWLVYLNTSGSAVIVARSTNNGANWTQLLSRSGSWDNPAIAAGVDGQVWVEVRSSSGVAGIGWKATGLGTIDMTVGGGTGFTATQNVPGTTTSQNYGDIAVLNDGSVLIGWTNSSGQGPVTNGVARDADGVGTGSTFGAAIFSYSTNVGGFDFIPPQNNRSVDSEPNFSVAPPGTAFAGRVYLNYLDETVNENSDTDVIVRYSDNGGTTWSAPIRVNNDPASPIRSQFLNQIAVDPTTGAIVASWHDSRNDNGVSPNGTNGVANDDAQFFGALSTDGGATWTNFLIDPGWSNAVLANNGIDFGDWTGSDFYNGKFFAVWASNASTLPNNPAAGKFDLATAKVDIIGAGLPGIFGQTFDDANGNGARDGSESGLPGVTVYLDTDNSGTLTGGDISTTTDSSGNYSFTSIAASNYTIRTVTPAGRRLTFPVSGSYAVSFDGVNSVTAKDFGIVNPRIAGTVFNDANDNGVFDGSESGLSGVTVYLDLDNSGTFNGGGVSTTSAADGSYALGGLADGTYVVRVVTPAGRRLTFPAAGSYSHSISSGSLVFSADHFGLTDRVRIAGRVFQDNNGNGVIDPGEPFISGARVFQDSNNNGIYDNSGGTFNSTNVPLLVPPSGTTGITTSNLTIGGVGNVNSLTVKVNITHTFDGDMVLTLISPAGTRITLANQRGGSGDNYTNTVFDDAAATAITAGTAPFSGTFRPEQALGGLIGQNGNGTWKLEVNDVASGDSGTLNSWSITLGSTEPSVITPADGSYAFTGLGAGSYNLRQVALANYVFTTPSGGGITLNPAAGDLATLNFGNFATTYTGSDITARLDPTGTNVQLWIDTPLANPPTYSAAKAILSTLSFTGTAGDDSLTIDAQNGSPLPSGGMTFAAGANGANGDVVYLKGDDNVADTVVFNAGSVVLNGVSVSTTGVEVAKFDGRLGNDQLTVNGGPDVQVFNSQQLAALTIAAGASASVPANGSTLIESDSLSIASTGLLDLFDNDLLLDYSGASQLGAVQALINLARNNGTWLGAGGLTSTSARTNPIHITTLGAMEATEYDSVYGPGALFDGVDPDATAVLVKYTYYGDANFSGTVSFDDYVKIDTGFNTHLSGWLNGDFNGDGNVNFDDYVLIDTAFNTQGGVL